MKELTDHYSNFGVSAEIRIASVDQLLELNKPKTYDQPPRQLNHPPPRTPQVQVFPVPHVTAGIFRGQPEDWSLIPGCFRPPKFQRSVRYNPDDWVRPTKEFFEFCGRAEKQNPDFPKALSARMSIAQHFGVDTPLLDWSRDIYPAIFFAIRSTRPVSGYSGRVFIYHIVDEKILASSDRLDEGIYAVNWTAFVEPASVDRRIERQRGVFTYHTLNPYYSIPVDRYVIEGDLVLQLVDLMKQSGRTSDYYFPDYGGIADTVKRLARQDIAF